jgi:hypothetical protein
MAGMGFPGMRVAMAAGVADRLVPERPQKQPAANGGNHAIADQLDITRIVQHAELGDAEDQSKNHDKAYRRYRMARGHQESGPYSIPPCRLVAEKIGADDDLAMPGRKHMKNAVTETDQQQAPQCGQ